MGFPILTLSFFLLIISSLFSLQSAQQTLGFRCTNTSTSTCYSLIDYQLPNTTTLSSVQTLFEIKNLRILLAANDLPTNISQNQNFPASSILKIPFPCSCRNGTGISNRRPNYVVLPNDTLFHIAAEVFSRVVTFPQIQLVNNIPNADLIMVGQRLWIPLPCSCDDVEGQAVVHYGHLVQAGSTVSGIAEQFNTTESTLLNLNGMTSPSQLQASSILDVPLKVCTSMVTSNSTDYPLLVPNGTSIYTANNCVRCKCNAANNWILQCESSGLTLPRGQTCPLTLCEGTSVSLGNITSGPGCNRSRCVYTGYADGRIHTAINQESTCPEGNNNDTPGSGWKDRRLSFVVGASLMAVHLLSM
ncbi:lysM domain-containing GPI-anchored protein 2 [Cynara cardunculus var. scolymus]|uniref:lysM domain-containing GPI-anchored protein 2 n=1 Tax=Cynara cardunculus var. scolymus TaxID=59895 RepID=UPI000D62C776|nr:lysM domain-containing GPI-anchored protein 2 [Cynara cardunculus var. scolymus]